MSPGEVGAGAVFQRRVLPDVLQHPSRRLELGHRGGEPLVGVAVHGERDLRRQRRGFSSFNDFLVTGVALEDVVPGEDGLEALVLQEEAVLCTRSVCCR